MKNDQQTPRQLFVVELLIRRAQKPKPLYDRTHRPQRLIGISKTQTHKHTPKKQREKIEVKTL